MPKQSEKLKNSVTNIQTKGQFSENLPASTEAFAVVISGKSLVFPVFGCQQHIWLGNVETIAGRLLQMDE